MTQATQLAGPVARSLARSAGWSIWTPGLYAAASWAIAAIVTKAMPNVVPWGSDDLFALLVGLGALGFAALAFASPRNGWIRETLDYYGPWFIAIGVWLALWEFTTAKTGWLPKPFFSAPTGLLHVYVTDWRRLLDLRRLLAPPMGARFRSRRDRRLRRGRGARLVETVRLFGASPILKLIGPAPATT